jgi:hypothetical protein
MAFSAPTKPSYAVALGAALLIGAWSFRQRRRRKDESSDSIGTSEAKRNVPSQQQTPIRVLVTGFNDWRDLEAPSDIWRSQENPSSRLLLGSASACPSLHRQGVHPLVNHYETSYLPHEFLRIYFRSCNHL